MGEQNFQGRRTVKGKAGIVVKRQKAGQVTGVCRAEGGRAGPGSQVGVRVVAGNRQERCWLSRRSDKVCWETGLFIQGMVSRK